MPGAAKSREWSAWAAGNTAVSSHSMAALCSPPGCGTAGYPCHACLLCQASLPRMPAWHWQGYPRRNSCCRGTRAPAKSGLLLFILMGKQRPPGGTFKTCFLTEGDARFLTGLCCRWRVSCKFTLKTMWKDKQESHARYPHVKYSGNANEWGRKRRFIKASQDGF